MKSKDAEMSSRGVDLLNLLNHYRQRSTTIIKITGNWHNQLINEDGLNSFIEHRSIQQLKELATQLLSDDVANFIKVESRSRNSQAKFRKTLQTHGTAKDKVAAHVLCCMEAPVHCLYNLNKLLDMVNSKSKGGYFMEVVNSLKELFESVLFPDGHIARKFEAHNFSVLLPFVVTAPEQAERQLLLWYYEDQLLFAYQRLIKQLTQVAHDSVEKSKMSAVRGLLDLLTQHPDQECDEILTVLINKLGDPSKKLASQTLYGIRTLLQRRPLLKMKVVNLVEEFLYRSNIKDKAQYYGLCLLKDIIFSKDDQKLAEKLIKLYFGFFKACTKKGEVDTRLMAAILRGINRSFPYIKTENQAALEEQLNTLYKICHLVNFSIAVQALQLIYQVITCKDDLSSDRFYQVLYGRIQDSSFGTSSANSAFLNLMFKALCRDESINRIRAFIKRLLQACQYLNSHMICGVLYLISEIVHEKPTLHSVRQVLVAPYLHGGNDQSDDEECFPDLDINMDFSHQEETNGLVDDKMKDDINKNTVKKEIVSDTVKPTSSWVHRINFKHNHKKSLIYDPYHRNPLHCCAEQSPLWELRQLQNHYHPSVSLFASNVLHGEQIKYTGDPLQDFTLIKFLDKFVYKNPRKTTKKDSAGGNILGSKSQYVPTGVKGLQINSKEFKNLDDSKVPEDEKFFHKYFTKYKSLCLSTDNNDKEDNSDTESVGDEEFDSYLKNFNGGIDSDDGDDDIEEELNFAAGATRGGAKNNIGGDDGDDDDEEEEEEGENGQISGDSDDNDDEEDPWNTLKTSGDSDEDDNLDLEEDDVSFDEGNVSYSDDDDVTQTGKRKLSVSKSLKDAKGKNPKKKSKKTKFGDSVFASAEDFAHLIEENVGSSSVATTTEALSNRDASHVKQLNWEVKRDKFIKGVDWKAMKNQKKTKSFQPKQGVGNVKNNKYRRKAK